MTASCKLQDYSPLSNYPQKLSSILNGWIDQLFQNQSIAYGNLSNGQQHKVFILCRVFFYFPFFVFNFYFNFFFVFLPEADKNQRDI